MKNRDLSDSFNNAINGIIHAIRHERNMKIHIIAAVCTLIASLLFELTRIEFIIICMTITAVIICELINTAVEVLVDIIVDVYHPKAKVVKDVAAGAVMVSALNSLLVAYFIFFDRVSTGLEKGIMRIRHSPMHLTAIALLFTIIAVVLTKACTKTGTPFKGGLPSGHTAVGFAVTTAVALWTDDAKLSLLSLIMALLLAHSRLETKIHRIWEVVLGAILGSVITLLLFQVFYY